ncbi:MAG: formate dehydrogenase subunit gamma [Clostridia bacterium]|nr:formate dehydrogenase subunit gamma [Clostridia bacterium]
MTAHATLNPLAANINNLYLDYIGIIILLATIGVLIGTIGHYLIIGPNAKRLGKLKPEILRLNVLERFTHFVRMTSFIILAITGIAFAIFNVKNIGLTYDSAYKIHIVFAILFALSSLVSIVIWLKDSIFKTYDWEWFKVMGGYLTRKEIHPPSGRFNAGQKAFYWYSTLLSVLVIGSGYLLAYPEKFNLESLVWATVIHGISAIALMAGVIAHAYLGSFANPGTIGTIIHGKVAKEWAKNHHPQWYQEEIEQSR